MKKAHHKRTNIVPFHLHKVSRVAQFIKCRKVTARGWKKRTMEIYCLTGTVSVRDDEKVLELDDGNGGTVI